MAKLADFGNSRDGLQRHALQFEHLLHHTPHPLFGQMLRCSLPKNGEAKKRLM